MFRNYHGLVTIKETKGFCSQKGNPAFGNPSWQHMGKQNTSSAPSPSSWEKLSTSGESSAPTEPSNPSTSDLQRAVPLPRGGYWEKLSTHMGLPGIISTMAASPDFRDLGLSSSFLPERRSIFSFSSANLQAICAVWQSMTGE